MKKDIKRESKKEIKEDGKEEIVPVPLQDKNWRGGTMIVVPMYGEIVSLFVGSPEDLLKYFNMADSHESIRMVLAKAAMMPQTGAPTEGITFGIGATDFILLPYLDLSDMKCVGSLYHEALHVALRTLRRIGVEIGENGESLTYLQGYIVDSLIAELKSGRYGTLMPDGTKVPCKVSIPLLENKPCES